MEFDYELLRSCGEDVRISSKATIKHPHLISIGSHVAIDECIITVQADLGDYIHISPYVTIIGGIKAFFQMGHFTAISAGVRIVCAGDGWMGDGFIGPTIPDKYRDKVINQPVIMENFSGICTNAVILPGVIIREGAVIVANSYVTKNIPAWEIWAGTPARKIKERPREEMLAYARELGYR